MRTGFRTIVHVDMDAFFTSVEVLDHPELRGKPVVVGADPRNGNLRGVVSAASYEARRFGVRSAQPVSTAYKLCPQAIFMPHRFDRYRAISDTVMEVLAEFSDRLLRMSIDEAVLDCSETGARYGTWKKLGTRIKEAIYHKTGLTCTIGIASGKTLAKMATEIRKPDGLTLVHPGKEREFLAPLPVEAIPGVGPRAKETLNRLGLRKIGDLQAAQADQLGAELGRWAQRLLAIANGIDDDEVETAHERKSFGEERTYQTDLATPTEVRAAFAEIADDLARRLGSKNTSGRTITIKVRFADFHTVTRAQTIPVPARTSQTLFETAWRLFEQNISAQTLANEKIRLLGIQLSNLYSAKAGEQLWLF
jgi:nucleotidyltransferase/DNA polymerase involved in DNA repair